MSGVCVFGERGKMSELKLYRAKKLYEEIEKMCLTRVMQSYEKCAFKIYSGISKRCYNMFMQAKNVFTIVPLEKMTREEISDEEYINNLNKIIYKTYYWDEDKFGENEKNDTERAFFEGCAGDVNAYANLQKFSDQQLMRKNITFNDVICMYEDVLNVLRESNSFEELENKINFILSSYDNDLTNQS